MNNFKFNRPATIIKIACVFLFLMADAGCGYESQTITGKVLDESGATMSDVAVTACYSGWGLSNGQLVWDKDFCSEPAVTDSAGLYVIHFKGPGSMRLMARKDGWIQTQDFNTTHSRVILTRSEDYSARLTSEARLQEKKFRNRLPGESDTEYYCRVIVVRIKSFDVNYQGERLSITPSLLTFGDHNDALFALRGSSAAVDSFSKEALLKINGIMVRQNFSIRLMATPCTSDLHFMALTIPEPNPGPGGRIEILVPSIRALLDMHVWNYSEKP